MQKQVPTVGRLLVMAVFTLSCFGLLLYLWSAFGGPVPLKPHGYRFHASFAEATQLAQEADVRISGVNVGRVKKIELDEILRAFDKKTRESFQVWQQDLGAGIEGHGQDFSDALGSLTPFAENSTTVL